MNRPFLYFSLLLLAAMAYIMPTNAMAQNAGESTMPQSFTAEQTRKDFLALIDRPRVDLAPEVESEDADGDFQKFRFTYATEAGMRVPGLMLARESILNDGKRHPVVIVLHGTTANKEQMLPFLRKLAAKGLIGVAIDGRYHGERGKMADYNAGIARSYADGKTHTLYLDTCWDAMRLIDYLQTRSDVDPNRIGMMGFSKGGVETWMTSAIDKRVAVSVPCISVQSFEWEFDNGVWEDRIATVKTAFEEAAKAAGVTHPDAQFVKQFYNRLVPGIFTEFDGPMLLPMIAPRPLLIISSDKDQYEAVPGLNLCVDAAKPVFEKDGCPDRFQLILQKDTHHTVRPESIDAAVEWFDRWLNDPALGDAAAAK